MSDPVCRPEHRRWILVTTVLASSMGYIDASVTAIARPAIRADLGGSLAQGAWVAGAYLVTLSSLILVGGAMADRLGVVRVYGAGIVAFVASSMLCALAQNMTQLNLARALQGSAAAFMVPGSMTLIARAFPRDERGAALGVWAAAAPAATALGPVLGGLLLTFGGSQIWRAIFALNLPLGAAALWLLTRYALPDKGRPGTAIDLIGAALATLALGFLALALTAQGHTAALMSLAALASALFLWREATTPAPMIRLTIFRNRAFALVNLATLLLYTAVTGVMLYLPMTAISAWHVSPIGVTAAFLPSSFLIASLSTRSGRLADRIGPGPLMTAGATLVAIAYALLAMNAVHANFYTAIVPVMALVGLGMALLVAPLTAAVMANAADSEQGAASGINNAVARASGLISAALMGTVARLGYGQIQPDHPGFGIPSDAPGHVAATSTAFSHIAILAAALALTSAAISTLIRRRPG